MARLSDRYEQDCNNERLLFTEFSYEVEESWYKDEAPIPWYEDEAPIPWCEDEAPIAFYMD